MDQTSIGGHATREAHARVNRAAGNTVAEGDIAGVIHSDASHPAVGRIGRVSALLENAGRAAWASQFVPPHSARAADRMVDHERFMIAEVTICQAIHKPISERVKLLPGIS